MHLQLQPLAKLIEEDQGSLRIKSPWVDLKWEKPSFIQHQYFSKLAKEGATEDALTNYILENEDVESLMHFYKILNRLKHHSLLSYTVFEKNVPLLKLDPLSIIGKVDENPINKTELFMLSPFCFSYTLNNEIVLETPLKIARIFLKAAEMPLLLHDLAKPINLQKLCAIFPTLSSLNIEGCLKLLDGARMLDFIT